MEKIHVIKTMIRFSFVTIFQIIIVIAIFKQKPEDGLAGEKQAQADNQTDRQTDREENRKTN